MIQIRNLRKVFPDGKVAVQGIDLVLAEGMIGLLGPNGAGKTTFLSMLCLNREPTEGSRAYFGLDAAGPSNRNRIRALIGYLPQNFFTVPYLTGLEYLIHCARLRGMSLSRAALRARAIELLEQSGHFITPRGQRRRAEMVTIERCAFAEAFELEVHEPGDTGIVATKSVRVSLASQLQGR